MKRARKITTNLVFAYGSNLCPEQMMRRCPSADFVSVAGLPRNSLAFVGNSVRWGGGVATMRPDANGYVVGALWSVGADDLRKLDMHEGVPTIYTRQIERVLVSKGRSELAHVYRHVEAPLAPPSDEYLRRILDGYAACFEGAADGLRPLVESAARAAWSATRGIQSRRRGGRR